MVADALVNLGHVPTEEFAAKVDALMRYIEASGFDPELVERANGPIGQMKSARADDRLRELVATGVVGEGEKRAWNSVRNVAAHGNWDRYDDKLQS